MPIVIDVVSRRTELRFDTDLVVFPARKENPFTTQAPTFKVGAGDPSTSEWMNRVEVRY